MRWCFVNTAGSQTADVGESEDDGRRKLTYQLGEAARGANTAEAKLSQFKHDTPAP